MRDETPIHTYPRPRITELVRGAVAQGMTRDAIVAVVIDIITSADFDTAATNPADDSAP